MKRRQQRSQQCTQEALSARELQGERVREDFLEKGLPELCADIPKRIRIAEWGEGYSRSREQNVKKISKFKEEHLALFWSYK